MAGNVSKNTGIFVQAILSRPDVSLPARYATVHVEALTFPQLLKIWTKVTGKEAVYMACSTEEYDALYPRFGEELGLQYEYMTNVPDAQTGEPGLLSKEALGIEGLVGVEDTFRELISSWA